MSDRFPYNLPSRAALCRLIREKPIYRNIKDDQVTFEDMYHSPVEGVPGRTFIEMVNLTDQIKSWFVFRRLDLKIALKQDSQITIQYPPTPRAIAEEINRSRGLTLGPDDISFSDTIIANVGTNFKYTVQAMLGSYVYFGDCTLEIEVITKAGGERLLETASGGFPRILEDGTLRVLER